MDANLTGQRGERRGKFIGMTLCVITLLILLFLKLQNDKAKAELVKANADIAAVNTAFKTKSSEYEAEIAKLQEKIKSAYADNEKISAASHDCITALQEEITQIKAKLNETQTGKVRVVAAVFPAVDNRSKLRPAVIPNAGDRIVKLSEDIELALVSVAPGSFMMGGDPKALNYAEDEKLHQVTLTKEYWIGRYEVTQKQFSFVIDGAELSQFKDPYRPVDNITWAAAMEFCRKLTTIEQKAGNIPAGYEYRLPTEAEWEFAARGGTLSKNFIFSGSNDPAAVASCGKKSSGPIDIGIFSPNELKIYDMSGNVWEWCYDWYGNYTDGAVTNPQGAKTGEYRVTRGGGWDSMDSDCRVANRNAIAPDYLYRGLGFRIALAPAITPRQ
jgi:formylglycine-generating enzyme required for sulfatase activity